LLGNHQEFLALKQAVFIIGFATLLL